MKLTSFKIEHVKSIVDSGVCHLSEADNILVLAGQNEAGKSAILEALNYFGNGASAEFIRLSKRLNIDPEVVCTFSIAEEDCSAKSADVNQILNDLKVVDCGRVGIADDDDIFTLDSTDDKIRALIEKLDFEDRVADENTDAKPTLREDTIKALKEDLFDSVITHILNRVPQFVFYDSFSGLLPGEIKITEIATNQAVRDFQTIFGVSFADAIAKDPRQRSAIKSEIEQKAELDLNTYWSQKRIDGEADRYRFEINLIPGTAAEQRVEFLIHRDDGTPLYMEQKSKGFQWFNAFMLRLKAIGVKNDDFSNYVLLIDEPGQGLHETAQKNVKVVLEELANKGMQVLYTTHNPSLIGVENNELLRIRLVYQAKEVGTKINTISQFASSKEGASKDALSPIITAMGIGHMGQIVDASKLCVAVEGITDQYYLTAFQTLLGITTERAFIPACGVNNVRPLISILIGWGTNFKAVFDDGKDGKKVYKDIAKYLYQEDTGGLAQRIMKLDGFDGIEDLFEKEDFLVHVLGEASLETTEVNSEIAKNRKKELLARMFVEKVRTNRIRKEDLRPQTIANFTNVLTWIGGEAKQD